MCRNHRRCEKKAARSASRAVQGADEKVSAFVLQVQDFAASKARPEDEAEALSRWGLMMQTMWRKVAVTAGTLHVKLERSREARNIRTAERLAECQDAAKRERARPLIRAHEKAQASLEISVERVRRTRLIKAEYDSVPLGMDKNAALHQRLDAIYHELLAVNEKLPVDAAQVEDKDRLYNTSTQTHGPTYERWLATKGMKVFWTDLQAELREKLKTTPTPQQLELDLVEAETVHARRMQDAETARVAMDAALANGRPKGVRAKADELARNGRIRIKVNGVVHPATDYAAA